MAFSGAHAQNRPFKTVVIDAGHGGHDTGARPGTAVLEKHVALDVSLRLDKLLRTAGYRTVLTRNRDVFIPLSRRVAISNAQKDAIFVSVHFNAAARTGATGIETFWNNSPHCYALAYGIQRNLITRIRTENRGVKRRGFYVLRNNRNPAVLVECGFLTNPREAKLATNPRHRQLLAEQIYRGIVEYGGRPIAPSTTITASAGRASAPAPVPGRQSPTASRNTGQRETLEDRRERLRQEYLRALEQRKRH